MRSQCILCRRLEGIAYDKTHKKERHIYYLNNKEKQKNSDLKRLFGLSLKDYNLKLKEQNYVCAICKKQEHEKEKNKSKRSLGVDHDHKNNNIRGLLCGKCNKALGLFEDDINNLKNAIKYLENYNVTN